MDNNNIVKGIFEDFFNESLVDYKEDTKEVLVRFPYIRVTNENDKSIDITNLFAKVKLGLNGTMVGYVTLNRSEYTREQFESDYAHSHLSGINIDNFTKFRQPCFGTGPILETMNTLNKDYDEEMWRLFCFELNLYVQRESLTGIPYRRLESVGVDNNGKWRKVNFEIDSNMYIGFSESQIIIKFIKRLASKEFFKINYINESYGLGMSLYEIVIKLSNEFIDFYNEDNSIDSSEREKAKNMLVVSKVKDGTIYRMSKNASERRNFEKYIGKLVCVFKGTEYRIVITDNSNVEDNNTSLLLKFEYVSWIVECISKIMNYEYKSTGENRATFSKSLYSVITENAGVI